MWTKRGFPSDPVSRPTSYNAWACVRQTNTSTGHCSIARQHQSEQVDVGRHFYHNEATPARETRHRTFARVVRKKCSRHEERRLIVATRQTALSSRNETANETPNFAAGIQTNCTNPNTYQPCFSTRGVLSPPVRGGFGFSVHNDISGREDDTYSCQDSTYQWRSS